jgi:hypothetical protein
VTDYEGIRNKLLVYKMTIQGHWRMENQGKEAHNFGSKIKRKRPGGSLNYGFLVDTELDLNEDYCKTAG